MSVWSESWYQSGPSFYQDRLFHLALLTFCWRRSWDEKRVGEWLREINCPQYEQLFKCESSITFSNFS